MKKLINQFIYYFRQATEQQTMTTATMTWVMMTIMTTR